MLPLLGLPSAAGSLLLSTTAAWLPLLALAPAPPLLGPLLLCLAGMKPTSVTLVFAKAMLRLMVGLQCTTIKRVVGRAGWAGGDQHGRLPHAQLLRRENLKEHRLAHKWRTWQGQQAAAAAAAPASLGGSQGVEDATHEALDGHACTGVGMHR